MVVVKFRSSSELKDMLKKAKKMHKFTKELVDCFEEKIEEDDYDDDDENYRDEDDEMMDARRSNGGSRRRYRRGM